MKPGNQLRWPAVLGAVVLAAGAVVHVLLGQAGAAATSAHRIGHDDAYISYRYAENLAAGRGLVFNPGERVEGYTNLLWVLAAALVRPSVGRDGLYLTMTAVNLLALLAAYALFWRQAVRRLGPTLGGAAAVAFALTPVVWAWTASGLETVVVLALQIALWTAVERLEDGASPARIAALALVLVLAVLTRADGFVLVVLAAAYFVVRRRHRLAAWSVVTTAPVVGIHFLWRYLYYGDLLPNTYHAKVSGPLADRLVHAVEQLCRLAFTQGLLVHLLAVGGMLALHVLRHKRPGFGVFLPAGILGYWIYVGGDHFGERFLLLFYPLGLVAFLELFGGRLDRGRLGLLLVLVVVLHTWPLAGDSRFRYSRDRYDGWITLGQYLGERFPDRRLAVGAAGKIPFFSGLETIDMRGLNDRHIARLEVDDFVQPGHDKGDLAYVLSREPDLIAAWIGPRFDMSMELDRETYRRAGYRLRLLVNMSRRSQTENVIDVRGLTERERRQWIRQGYSFGVLEKVK